MTRIQSNNQWSGGIAAHPAPKYPECINPLEKFSPRFFGIKTASSSMIIFQRDKLSKRSINHLCWCNWRTFWRKNAAGRSPLHDNASARWALATQKKLAYWASNVLTTNPILRIWPRRTTTCSLDWKSNWKFAIFRPTRRSLLPRRPGWTDKLQIFFERGSQKLEQRAKKCTERRGSISNKSRVWSL